MSTRPKQEREAGTFAGLSEELAAQLATLPDESARQRFLERHQELQRANVVGWLTDVVRRYIRMDTKQALAIAEFNVALARTIHDEEALANALLWLGNALYNTGRHREALEQNAQALGIFRRLGKTTDIARTLNASIQPLLLLGHYEQALAAAEEASAIFRAEGNLWRLARVELNSGNIYYRQDRFSEALAHYRAAYEALLPYHEQDAEAIAVVLHNIAVCSISLNQFREAHSTYEAARKFAAEHQMPTLVAQADYNIAWLYYLRGDYSRAIGMLRSTREACRANGDDYHFALCHMDLAEIYLELNLSEEAEENARDGAALFEKLGHGYETAKCYANLAIALGQQHQMFGAIEMFTKAREIMVRERNQVWPSVIDLYQALLLFDEGRYFEARRLCVAALEFFRTSSVPGKAVLCEVLLARLHLRAGEAARALEFAAGAVERARGLESPLLAYEAHLVCGEIHMAAANAAGAYASFREARLALETLRSNLHRDELKISFVKNRLQVYEALVALCLARGASAEVLEEAFGYIEEAKSRSLLHLTGRRSVGRPALADAQSELVRKISDLREELNFYYHRIEQEQLRPEERSPDRIHELQELARKREDELLRVWREAPDPAQLSPDHLPAFAGLAAVQAALPADSALIEYFYLQDRIVAAVVTADGLAIHGVTIAPRVNSLIKLLQFQLAKMARGTVFPTLNPNASLDATRDHLRNLYQELLVPVIASVRASRLIFVPHGVLHHIPFHALFDGECYLIDRFAISYAPSASVFAVATRRSSGSARGALVLGVPDQAAPSIADEAEAIGRLLPDARVFSGAAATRTVLEQQGTCSRFIHIATHGFFRQDNPMFSGIRLGDTVLSLYDLYHLSLPAELVTLSGCATGMSVVAAGDELLGLMRGLLGAGASSVLLTLWDVHDQSTAEFMKSFYANLLRGADKDRALQQAMIALRSDYPHPYHWGPFSLIGNTSGIAAK